MRLGGICIRKYTASSGWVFSQQLSFFGGKQDYSTAYHLNPHALFGFHISSYRLDSNLSSLPSQILSRSAGICIRKYTASSGWVFSQQLSFFGGKQDYRSEECIAAHLYTAYHLNPHALFGFHISSYRLDSNLSSLLVGLGLFATTLLFWRKARL
jgi:hypothetical protein